MSKIKHASKDDIEDTFDLLHFRQMHPFDCLLSDVERRHIGCKVYGADETSIYVGDLTSIDEDSNVALIGNEVEVALSSCVLIN